MNELQTFLLEDVGVRGALVRLKETWQNATAEHHYPLEVQRLLGEGLAATVLLTTGLKATPSLSLQLESDGPLRLLLLQCSAELKVRGLAQWRPQTRGEALLGQGRLAVNLGAPDGGMFQGIVPLVANSLEGSLEAYFRQSEQLPTRLVLHVADDRVAGLLVQSLPGRSGTLATFEDIATLAGAVGRVALAGDLARELLPDLFAEHTIRLFPARAVGYDCRCTPHYLADIVRILGPKELRSILAEQGRLELTCEFCNRGFQFAPADVEAMLAGDDPPAVLH